jgi:hypothetical protein
MNTLNIKVKVFCYSCPDTGKIENDINSFLEARNIKVKHINQIKQTESCNHGGWSLTISIWYEENK